jgi:RES domain-containing protein
LTVREIFSAWRIAKHTPRYRADDLSGDCAMEAGGRWSSKGIPVVYGCCTPALAALETFAHLGGNFEIRNLFLVRIDMPAAAWSGREIVEMGDLEPDWASTPFGSATVELGDRWLARCEAPILLVPSALVPEEYNLLINPAHEGSRTITATVMRQYSHGWLSRAQLGIEEQARNMR